MRDDISKEMKHTEITLAVLEEYQKVFGSIDFSIFIKKIHTLIF